MRNCRSATLEQGSVWCPAAGDVPAPRPKQGSSSHTPASRDHSRAPHSSTARNGNYWPKTRFHVCDLAALAWIYIEVTYFASCGKLYALYWMKCFQACSSSLLTFLINVLFFLLSPPQKLDRVSKWGSLTAGRQSLGNIALHKAAGSWEGALRQQEHESWH